MGIKKFYSELNRLGLTKETMLHKDQSTRDRTLIIDFSIIYMKYLVTMLQRAHPFTFSSNKSMKSFAKILANPISSNIRSFGFKKVYIATDSDSIMKRKMAESIKRKRSRTVGLINSYSKFVNSSDRMKSTTEKKLSQAIKMSMIPKSVRSMCAEYVTIMLKTSLIRSNSYEAELLASAISKKFKKKGYGVGTRDTDAFISFPPFIYMMSISSDKYNGKIFDPLTIKKSFQSYIDINQIEYTKYDEETEEVDVYEININVDLIRIICIRLGCDFFKGDIRCNLVQQIEKLKRHTRDDMKRGITQIVPLFDASSINLDNIKVRRKMINGKKHYLLKQSGDGEVEIINYRDITTDIKTSSILDVTKIDF